MRIYRGLSYIPQMSHTVVTMGVFDGVHKGHKVLLEKTVKEAHIRKGTSVVITYDPHPKEVLNPSRAPKMLQNLQSRLEAIEKLGIEECIVFDFTKDFSQVTAMQFIEVIVQKIHPVHFVLGYDHTFGYQGKGNSALLKELGKKYHFTVETIDPVLENGQPISSTKLRNKN